MTDSNARQIAEFIEPLRVKPGSEVRLAKDFDPALKGDFLHKKAAKSLLQRGVDLLADYQMRLAAQDTHGVLVCLQALDAAGKDGTIRHVMSGLPDHTWKFSASDVRERRHSTAWDSCHNDRSINKRSFVWSTRCGLGQPYIDDARQI